MKYSFCRITTNQWLWLITIIGSLSFSSCKKFLEVTPPTNKLTSESTFSNDETAIAAITGLYIQLPHQITSDQTFYTSLYSDELNMASPSDVQSQFINSALQEDNSKIATIWSSMYEFIYRVNSCLEGLKTSTAITDSLNKQLTGEALFFRAVAYFYMANYFSDVPLVLNSNYKNNTRLPRTSVDEVYEQVIQDLKDAELLLQDKYPTAERIRVNRWAAKALLSRVYLYHKNWDEASALSNAIIESKVYGDLPELDQVFRSNSTEAILQFGYYVVNDRYGPGSMESYYLIPASTSVIPMYTIRLTLLQAFENDDKRLEEWTEYNVVDNERYYYPAKYKDRSGTGPLEYYVFLRLAEQYLIRAESRAQKNLLSEAVNDIDVIRARAGLPLIKDTRPDISKEELLNAIYKERRIEFFAEQGHRWFDLQRTGTASVVLKALKPSTWKEAALLWPIPYVEQQLNSALTPNPGYH